jgi:hypothetical protein
MRFKISNLLKTIFIKNSKKYAVFLIVFLTNIYFTLGYSQDSFRRHFLIVYDISQDFRSLERNNFRFQRALEDLFQNLRIDNSTGNSNVLISEKKQGKIFFDRAKDEISFYHFNIPADEIRAFSKVNISDANEVSSSFLDSFIKTTPITWSGYRKKSSNLIDFISNILRLQFNPSEISAPNLVYPLIMDKINSEKPAEEYILIILTQKTPESYNDQDIAYLNKIYPGSLILDKNTAASFISNQIDNLNRTFKKIDYFNYTFNAGRIGDNSIGIYGYNIIPQGVDPDFSTPAVSINSEIKLSQTRFKSQIFRLSPVKFTFPQSSSLRPVKTVLKITDLNDTVVFQDTISYLKYSGKWISDHFNSDRLTKFIYKRSSLKIRRLKIILPELFSESEFNELKINFQFIALANPLNSNPINYIFFADAQINENNVSFASVDYGKIFERIWNIFYHIFLPIIIFTLLLILIFYGKPQKLDFKINGYLDSILQVNYNTFGQIHTPYKGWKIPYENEDKIRVELKVHYRSRNYFFNWRPVIDLRIKENESVVPGGFKVFLMPDDKSDKRYSPGDRMHLKLNKEYDIDFFICIGLTDPEIKLDDPKLCQIKVETSLKLSGFFTGGKMRKSILYEFHIGNDLGDVWVGLDPGTTGSCVSIGDPKSRKIILGKYLQKNVDPIKIIPSKIVFDTSKAFFPTGDIIPPSNIYKYGIDAEFFASYDTSPSIKKFQSFKKLLGYKDALDIEFSNNQILQVSGKVLSGIIIKGMYDYLRSFLEETDKALNFGTRENNNYVFSPKRVVIAVPNNSTISKIQEIIDSVGYLGQFKEIRYIYEAEAVLFYYLKNYKKFNKALKAVENEAILIFDMGGATINATIINVASKVKNEKTEFYIDILGKIGYSIGGDTIDYCLAQFILKFADDIQQLRAISINESRDKLSQLAKELKEEYIYKYFRNGHDSPSLIGPVDLAEEINKYLELNISIAENSNIHRYFTKDDNGKFPLFSDPLFTNIIYNNVRDAINEVLDLSENRKIDTVIFSGRSTHFPFIRETVEGELNKRHLSARKILLDLDDSKTAVAEGACWYGIINNNIKLRNLKTYASYGVGRTLDAMANVEFIDLIKSGCHFYSRNNDAGLIGKASLTSDFNYDGHNVNFYQIMGKEGQKILEDEHQKHKFSRIASIHIDTITEALEMTIKENDDIICKVRVNNDEEKSERGVVSNQEITEANEEHYTWVLNL